MSGTHKTAIKEDKPGGDDIEENFVSLARTSCVGGCLCVHVVYGPRKIASNK